MRILSRLSLVVLASLAMQARAEDGVTDKEIVVGMTGTLLGGPASYGFGSKEGIESVFKRINDTGGVNGRKLRLIFLEDNFKGQEAQENAKKLVEKEKILLFLGGNGSPQVSALVAYAAQSKVPHLFRISGIEPMRQPTAVHFANLRTGYTEEADTMIDYAVKKKNLKEIGILYQDDPFGTGTRNSVGKALNAHGLKAATEQPYKNGEEKFDAQIEAFKKSGVKAIYLASVYKVSALFIKQAREKGYTGAFLGNSLMTANTVIEDTGKAADNTYITDILPLPTNTDYELVRNFQRDLKAAGYSKLDGPHLEGYLSGEVFVWALKKVGKNVTREAIENAISSMKNENFGGIKLTWNPNRRQLIDKGFVLEIEQGKAKMVN